MPFLLFDSFDYIRQREEEASVLHGGSGTPDEILIQTIQSGICKINVNTEVSISVINYLQHANS
ncbi:hypothetical protein CR203_14235 [Salipaludibacillus neizhouensis]|uniref:Uncharacterized protein n=2 Tax=Salipaludibacillus neizhouensis TaxID=885475 RepID=A0A3A9KGE2_9BACI|nr:hypothetical protein CR203_14235 [Salipaludibacillus neizhouensis]